MLKAVFLITLITFAYLGFAAETGQGLTALNSARCVPSIAPKSGGKVEGFKCFNMSSDNAFREAGIKDGDLLKAFDGVKLDSPQKMEKLVSLVRTKSYIEILLVRNGQEEVLSPKF